tara:strand:+ start:342 stop:626 length:285 start_codon:yes stop_codon:yes gene_type:complete
MTLNDREKFILHLVSLMTMQHFGKFKEKDNLHEIVLKNRCRRLTGNDVNKIYEDIQEEMLLGSAIYEEADTLGVPINKKEPNEVDEYGVDLGGR